MSIDTGRKRIDEARQRGRIDRLTPAAKPGQTGELLAPSPPQESADQNKPRERNEPSGSEENAGEGAPGRSLFPAWLRRLRYYGLALLLVAMAAMVRWALGDVLSPTPGLVFYLAWVGAAAFGGLGPGLLATLASWWCIGSLFDSSPWQIGFGEPASIARIMIFLAGGVVVSVVGEKMRRVRIHERRQGRELAESRKQYRGLVEKINDWVWEIDADGVYTYSSPRALELLGYGPEEIVGKTPFDLMPPAEAQRVWNAFRPIWLERKPLELFENTLVRKDGSLVTVETSGMPVFAEDGSFLGYTGIDRDVTSRKEAEEALRESEERFRKIFEEGPIGMVLTSRDFGFFRANPAFCRMLGYPSEEMNGLTFLDVTHPEHRAADRDNVERLWQGEIPIYRTEKRYIAKNGDIRWGNLSASLIQDREGRPLYALAIVEDITERKRAEEALREWNGTLESRVAERTKELEHRARQLQKLTLELTEAEERERKRLAEILHDDLQQVLAAAKFQVSLLGSRARNDAESQEIAGQAGNLLVDAIAKSRSLSHELSAPVLSRSDLDEAFEWLAEQMWKKHGFMVHVETRDQIEVASEPLRILLYRAAQELLFNVVKHAGVGEARLRVRRQRGRIRLSVSDHGRGFDPTQPSHNLGFGLLSIRERVGYLGGRLKIRSAVGKGSTFLISMPDAEGPP